jgi:nicotinate-nucleotide adenylyltransferase
MRRVPLAKGARIGLPRGARIGLLGGSFNPAHAGHRHISLSAMRLLGLDEVWWLVSPQNPLKAADGMGSLENRRASASIAARHPRIRVLTVEAELGTRYTVDTVAALQARYAQAHFIWLMGADNLAQFHRWRGWRRLARRVAIAIFPRPGYGGAALTAPAMAWLGRWRHPQGVARQWQTWELPAIVMLNIRLSPLSASRLRAHDPDWASRLPPGI